MSDICEQLDAIRICAAETRKWAEDFQKKHADKYEDDLCGMCVIASAKLFKRLEAAGLSEGCEIVLNDCHGFILVNGTFVVDITATQFVDRRDSSKFKKFDKVLICPWKELQYEGTWWEIEDRYTDIDDLREEQIVLGWPEHQIAL